MVAKASIIEIYARADAAGKVDIICKNYSNFIGIVDGYTEGLRYMIESEKAYNRKKNHGDLGVRVQTLGIHSDITADTAISNIITRDAIIACDFSGDVLEGVDRGEKYRKDAYTLRRMRADYELFNQQLCILGRNELRIFSNCGTSILALDISISSYAIPSKNPTICSLILTFARLTLCAADSY